MRLVRGRGARRLPRSCRAAPSAGEHTEAVTGACGSAARARSRVSKPCSSRAPARISNDATGQTAMSPARSVAFHRPTTSASRCRTHADVSTTSGTPGPYGFTADGRRDARRPRRQARGRSRACRRRSPAARQRLVRLGAFVLECASTVQREVTDELRPARRRRIDARESVRKLVVDRHLDTGLRSCYVGQRTTAVVHHPRQAPDDGSASHQPNICADSGNREASRPARRTLSAGPHEGVTADHRFVTTLPRPRARPAPNVRHDTYVGSNTRSPL